jgi:hypothetical protein
MSSTRPINIYGDLSQVGPGPSSESDFQAQLDKTLEMIEALENAAAVSFDQHQREIGLLERDVRRLSGEKTTLEQKILLADSLYLDAKQEAQRMHEEFDERLAIKEDIISELCNKLPLPSANPPEVPSICKENEPLMNVEYVYLCFVYPSYIDLFAWSTPLSAFANPYLPGVISRLEFHHNQLKKKYDVLLDEKRALARRFSDHIKQWKQLKVWYHTKYDAGDIDVTRLSDSAKKQHYS